MIDITRGLQVVTVSNVEPLYKGDVKADKVELISFRENGYQVVSQKGLYKPCDRAFLVLPDFCLTENSLFTNFIKPCGDYSKSYLGKIKGVPLRVRAKRFKLSSKPNGCDIYSNGILITLGDMIAYLKAIKFDFSDMSLVEIAESCWKDLGIYKYVEESEIKGNTHTREFPSGLYKTDETNINLVWDKLHFPVKLTGTQKIDGCSITIGYNKLQDKSFICSRNLEIDTHTKVYKTVLKTFNEKTLLEKILFWTKPTKQVIEYKLNDSNIYIKAGYKYLEKLKDFVDSLKIYGIVLRGELNGEGIQKNKNNPSNKEKLNIKFFGLDFIKSDGTAVQKDESKFRLVAKRLKLPVVPVIFNKTFYSKQEIIDTCEEYFKHNMVEGIVLRDQDTTFSAKYLNNEYDSKK